MIRSFHNGGAGGGGTTDYNDLSNKPTLGTASPLDVAASGNATSGQVVKGNDTRLSDARTPSAHTHPLSDITDAGNSAGKNVGTGSNDVAAGNTPAIALANAKAADDPTPFTLSYASTINADYNNGKYQSVTCTGDLVIGAPANGSDGGKLKLRVIAHSAGTALSLSGITVPSDSTFTVKSLTANKMYIVLLEKYVSTWILISVVGGY